MQQVAVGYDGSGAATAALRWAATEAWLREAKLAVWTVLDDQRPEDDRVLRSMRRTVEGVLGDTPAEHHGLRGSPAAELVRAAANADLLVLGGRGRSPVATLLLGSVSHACLHAAPCHVVIVRPESYRPTAVGVVLAGVDGSSAGRRALSVAAAEAGLRGAQTQAVHAVHWDHLGVEFTAPPVKDLVAWGRRLVDREVAAAGVAARPVVAPGHAGDVLVRHSAHADLLVVGSRGRNPLTGLLLGSTADHCVRHAHCPVMVVRA